MIQQIRHYYNGDMTRIRHPKWNFCTCHQSRKHNSNTHWLWL